MSIDRGVPSGSRFIVAWASGTQRVPREETLAQTVVATTRRRRLVRVEVRATSGEPVDQPDPVHIERFNGVQRDRLGCLTRKTHAFAREIARWDALFGLTLFEHDWLRPHVALRVPLAEPADRRRYDQRTPAMVIGLTDRIWTWTEFLMKRGKAH
jgi:hypothetical protein